MEPPRRRSRTQLWCEAIRTNIEVRETDPADRPTALAVACGSQSCDIRPCARRQQFDRAIRWNRHQWVSHACEIVIFENDELVLREIEYAIRHKADPVAAATRCGIGVERVVGVYSIVASSDGIAIRTVFDDRYRVPWSKVVERAKVELDHRAANPRTHHLQETRAPAELRSKMARLKLLTATSP